MRDANVEMIRALASEAARRWWELMSADVVGYSITSASPASVRRTAGRPRTSGARRDVYRVNAAARSIPSDRTSHHIRGERGRAARRRGPKFSRGNADNVTCVTQVLSTARSRRRCARSQHTSGKRRGEGSHGKSNCTHIVLYQARHG